MNIIWKSIMGDFQFVQLVCAGSIITYDWSRTNIAASFEQYFCLKLHNCVIWIPTFNLIVEPNFKWTQLY